MLDRPAVGHEFEGQPIQQYGMRRSKAHISEIGGCGHETAPEMVVPNTVDHNPCSEGVLGINQPLGKGDSTIPFGSVRLEAERLEF